MSNHQTVRIVFIFCPLASIVIVTTVKCNSTSFTFIYVFNQFILLSTEAIDTIHNKRPFQDLTMSPADGETFGSPPRRKTIKSSTTSNNTSKGSLGYTISTRNSFEKLQLKSLSKNNTHEPNTPKPAPITITQKNTNVGEILGKIEANYTLKRLGIGIKIYTDTAAHRELIKETLLEANIEFFSHPTNDNKMFKAILRGLPEIAIDSIVSSLKNNNNITPQKVTMFKTSSGNKLYLVEFTKGEINKSELDQIKVVFNHIVHWEHYRKTKKGPTQCRKCGMYGHGMSHCNRSTICLVCGDKHDTIACPLSSQNNKNANIIFKCINCVPVATQPQKRRPKLSFSEKISRIAEQQKQ